MGLLFSILVACVGVVEFITIYRNLARNLNENYNRPNLTPDNRTCVKYANKESTTSGETSASDISVPHIRLCREFLSHEDIEVECTADVLQSKSKSPSPRRLLVTEKEKDTSRSPSPRRFVVSEAHDRGLTTNLPEFLITEGILKDRTETDTKRFTLVDTKRPSRENSPLPLPEQFVVIQDDSNSTLDSLKPIKKVIDIKLTSLNVQRASDSTNLPTGNGSQLIQTLPESVRKEVQNLESSAVRINQGSATNDYTDDYILPQSGAFEIYEDVLGAFSQRTGRQDSNNKASSRDEFPATGTEEFHRPPSPYPSLEITTKRPSVSSDVLNSSSISVLEVDEDLYRSRSNSSEKIDVILESSNYNTTQYWTNKILVTPPRKSKSQHHPTTKISEKSDGIRQRSKSATRHENDDRKDIKKVSSSYELDRNESSSFEEYIQENLDSNDGQNENFLKSLDGISSKKQSRCTEGRRSFKKKKHVQSLSILENEPSCSEATSDAKSTTSEARTSAKVESTQPFWLIFSGEYTKAMNKDWHGQHFCCWQCDESLTGQRYVLRDDHPYCVSCYESAFANACEKCSRTIGIDSKDLSYKDKHWHEACFLCTTCGESLVDKQFGSKGDRIYCGRCYDNQFASRCDGCSEIFRAGTKKMEYKTRQWHEKCFCCCVCKVPIGTQSFIPREQEIYCAKCYEEKFATRCIKCNKVITSGGVTYKNEPWHRECFTCTNCTKSLAGERFTSRDEKPYCAECFGELFAKRCFACNKPITGIGGTKFISFEDRHWHNDCFFCASCRTSLVGRGFITDQEDIICPECAKQKLI